MRLLKGCDGPPIDHKQSEQADRRKTEQYTDEELPRFTPACCRCKPESTRGDHDPIYNQNARQENTPRRRPRIPADNKSERDRRNTTDKANNKRDAERQHQPPLTACNSVQFG